MQSDINILPMHSPPLPGAAFAHQRPRRISITAGEPFHTGPTSPRSPSLSSLQAAATMNASFHHAPSPPIFRRRSSLMTNLQINDPTIPAAGEMVTHSSSGSPRLSRYSMDPHHTRQPSLGELHQKLEEEQESQANRLLHMIRIQQDQLNALQKQQRNHPLHTPPESVGSSAIADTPRIPAQCNPFDQVSSSAHATTIPALPHGHGVYQRPCSLSRNSSYRVSNNSSASRTGSPNAHPITGTGSLGPLTEDFLLGGARDESAFYQAETHTLTRENQMLRLKVKELERQVADLSATSPIERQAARAGSLCHSHSPLADASAVTSEAESVGTPATEASPATSPP